jgi:hypothetical protein
MTVLSFGVRDFMDVLLYFGSYAAISTLFASGGIAVVWVAFRAVRGAMRFVRVMANPQIEEDATKRVPPDYQLIHLKRAGQ